jgi:hypothetical protein
VWRLVFASSLARDSAEMQVGVLHKSIPETHLVNRCSGDEFSSTSFSITIYFINTKSRESSFYLPISATCILRSRTFHLDTRASRLLSAKMMISRSFASSATSALEIFYTCKRSLYILRMNSKPLTRASHRKTIQRN